MVNDINPNDRCPCGSGKKYKNCCGNKKPRKWTLSVQFEKPVTELRLGNTPYGFINSSTNGVPIKPEKVIYETSYDREKKKKVINKLELDRDYTSLNPDIFLHKFDIIYAVDTNTKIEEEKTISVTTIILCKLEKMLDGDITVNYGPLYSLEFWNLKEHAENFAWMKVIQFITRDNAYNPDWKIGIIVDSDLGNLSAYNSRSLPIYSDFYLPENFKLIYASAEVGKEEFFVNHLIAMCDDMARKLLTRILTKEIANENLEEVSDQPYTHFRRWIFIGYAEEPGIDNSND